MKNELGALDESEEYSETEMENIRRLLNVKNWGKLFLCTMKLNVGHSSSPCGLNIWKEK